MISLILGENLFQQGISSFFATNNDGFINSDLWKLLTIAGHRSGALSINVRFQDVVDSWVVLPGFPVLVVDYNNNEEKVALHQKHFKYSSSLNWNSISSLNDSNFFIPITYTTSKVKNFKDVRVDNWLTDNVIIFKLKDLGNKDDWIIFNTNILGLYKVQYSNSNWNNIIRGLDSDKHDGIHLFNRYQLVTDIMDFAQSGDVSYELMFNLLSYLRNEEKFEPWKASAFGFQRLIKIIHRTPLMDVFKEYYSELIQPLYAKHNYFTKFPEFSQTQDLFKLTVFALNWACSNDLDDCIDDTKKLFQKWRLGKDLDISLKFTPEVTYIFLCNAIRHGNMGDWNYLITEGNNFTFSKIAPEIIFNALSCSRDTLILSRYLSLILPLRSEEYLPDIAFPFLRLIMENPVGFDIGKTFLLNNFDAFQNSPNIKKLEIGRFFMHLASILISESEVNELRGFLKARGHFFKDYMPDIENSFKESQANIQWYKREHDKLKSVLKESIKNLQKKKDAETRR
ncbi:aminopeptidase N-like [Lycorma delicatula]|uniref:aminopeptidase N-like n=1 Tax=Lycorma delicatula TaxID=130591 RepID=UPI003F5194F2